MQQQFFKNIFNETALKGKCDQQTINNIYAELLSIQVKNANERSPRLTHYVYMNISRVEEELALLRISLRVM